MRTTNAFLPPCAAWVILATLLTTGDATAETNLDQRGLFAELQLYEQHNSPHRGNLLQHSAWTAMGVCRLFAEDSPWVGGLQQRDLGLAVVAGFLHDIGKAGDLRFTLGANNVGFKREHPSVGFGYLKTRQEFQLSTGATFDFRAWLTDVNGSGNWKLSDEDYRIIALVAKNHYDLGETIAAKWTDLHDRQWINLRLVRDYLNKLRHDSIIENVDFEKLVRITALVSAADVMAQDPVQATCPGFEDFNVGPAARQDPSLENYRKWGFSAPAGRASKARELIVTTLGGDQTPVFYHGTQLAFALDIAVNGFQRRRPINGSELGLGLYVARTASATGSYGDTYLELTTALTDQEIRECTVLETLLANPEFNDVFQQNTRRNGYDKWWTNPVLIPANFDGPYLARPAWLANGVNESPLCLTRSTSGNQIKFNFIHDLGQPISWDHPVPVKGKVTIRSVCHRDPALNEFQCESIQDFKQRYADEWMKRKMKTLRAQATEARNRADTYRADLLNTLASTLLDQAERDAWLAADPDYQELTKKADSLSAEEKTLDDAGTRAGLW